MPRYPTKNEREFNKWLIREYFKHGSVDEVFKFHRFDIPISYAGYQRVLDKWGVVKAAGANGRISEVINFLSKMIEEEVPLEKLYKKMPPSFRTSAATLYRILGYVKEGITRRVGTALVITPYKKLDSVLIAKDVSTPRIELGKMYGAYTLPMGFSSKSDTRRDSVLRVFQQEVFTEQTINKRLNKKLIPNKLSPFMYLDVVDVRVAVYHIPLKTSKIRPKFSSFKLKDFRFVKVDKIIRGYKDMNYRFGLVNAVVGYKAFLDFKKRNLSINPLQKRSELNDDLLATLKF